METLEGELIADENLRLAETYRMRVLFSTSKNRSYVNATVPIPSGGEIVDPSFDLAANYFKRGDSGTDSRGDERSEYDNDEYSAEYALYSFEPNRVINITLIRYNWRSFYRGQREVSFLFRVTTPGIYPTPPASAELMFEPEVFGWGKGRIFVIN